MAAVRIIQVKVKPNARESTLTEAPAGQPWLAKLKSPPVDGRANEELIALVAEHLGRRKADVTLKSGASGRIKLVLVAN
ncbi:MAG: DUF167 domain-containing protein [Verrucomicrobia bacterium]|nr:DUF167 domain-containing protein [Verrucomicrobiota bacterium]